MKTDKFYSVEVVDRMSRTFMLKFSGIILGIVLVLASHGVLRMQVVVTLSVIIAYIILFSLYISYTNVKRKISKVQIFKDRLSFSFEQQGVVSEAAIIHYSDIKEYKISALCNKHSEILNRCPNWLKNIISRNNYSIRLGYKTVVETNDGQKLEFETSQADGVLVYSPAYIYRMLDVKRCIPEFPLVLENIDDKTDNENFDLQFKYYLEKNANLSPFKNEKQLIGLLLYTIALAVSALLSALYITGKMYMQRQNIDVTMIEILWMIFGVLFAITVTMYLVTFITSFVGARVNKHAKKEIMAILKD